jgi:hypothetical protein
VAKRSPICRRCGHEKAWHEDGGCCLYGKQTAYGGSNSLWGTCRCPGYNARRSIPDRDVPQDSDELEIDRLNKNVQVALDALCSEMKKIIGRHREAAAGAFVTSPQEVLRAASKPAEFPRTARFIGSGSKPPDPKESKERRWAEPVGIEPVRLNGCQKTILAVLRQRAGEVKSTKQLAILCGFDHEGGYFRNSLGALRTAGFVTHRSLLLNSTMKAPHCSSPTAQLSGGALRVTWGDKLSACEAAILEALAEQTAGVSAERIAERIGKNAEGGYFRNSLGRVRGLGLVEGYGQDIRLNEALR